MSAPGCSPVWLRNTIDKTNDDTNGKIKEETHKKWKCNIYFQDFEKLFTILCSSLYLYLLLYEFPEFLNELLCSIKKKYFSKEP